MPLWYYLQREANRWLSDFELLLVFDHLTAPSQRRYGDAGEDSRHTGCAGLHGGKRRKGEQPITYYSAGGGGGCGSSDHVSKETDDFGGKQMGFICLVATVVQKIVITLIPFRKIMLLGFIQYPSLMYLHDIL